MGEGGVLGWEGFVGGGGEELGGRGLVVGEGLGR